jgi:hypothetical protein
MPSKSAQPSLMPSCTLETYDQNTTVNALGANDAINFIFTGLEDAIGNVTITYFHKGDDSDSGTYSLKVGIIFNVGDSLTGEFAECTDYVESPTTDPVTDDDFNTLYLNGGILEVSMAYDDLGSPNSCTDGQMAYVNLRYQYC